MPFKQKRKMIGSPQLVRPQDYYVCPFVDEMPAGRAAREKLGSTVWTKQGERLFVSCARCWVILDATNTIDWQKGQSPAHGNGCTHCDCGLHAWYLLEDWETHK